MPSAAELAQQLFMTTHAMKYAGGSCDERDGLGTHVLSMPRARVLAEVAAAEGTLHMSEVSAAMGVTPRNVTTIVDGLEQLGLVERLRSAEDRRMICLALTEHGRAHVEHVREIHQALAERFFAPLDGQERCLLQRLLAKVRAGIDAHAADDRRGHTCRPLRGSPRTGSIPPGRGRTRHGDSVSAMQQENAQVAGREHLSNRFTSSPTWEVADGDAAHDK